MSNVAIFAIGFGVGFLVGVVVSSIMLAKKSLETKDEVVNASSSAIETFKARYKAEMAEYDKKNEEKEE